MDVIKKGAIIWSLIAALGVGVLYYNQNNKIENSSIISNVDNIVETYSLERDLTGLYVVFKGEKIQKLEVPLYLSSYPFENTTFYTEDVNNDGLDDLFFETKMPFKERTIVYLNIGTKENPHFEIYKRY